MPRTRKLQYEIDSLPSQIIVPPSPPVRRQPMTPAVNYVYPLSSTPSDNIIEPINDFYSSSQRHNNNNTERLNPWNRYNSQRYSDDEQDRHVVYHKPTSR
jgi:hypothetical protein